jgi:hypothetical protein
MASSIERRLAKLELEGESEGGSWPEQYLTIVIPPPDGAEPHDKPVQTLKPGLLVVSPGYEELGAKLMWARIKGR